MKTIKVSQLVTLVSQFLTSKVHTDSVMISGELSNVRYVSGHCYFDLKDEEGQLSCTLWRSNASRVGFTLEDGMAVLVHGTLDLYVKRGQLKFNVDHVELGGIGALYLQLEERKKRLAAEGLFDQGRKKPRPEEINKIAIVTGKTTAGLQDALKTIRLRWPMLQATLFPAPVQGNDAPPKIVAALKEADAAGMDAVLLIRGGGSFEDLFCFNDEQIVRTLAAMKTYTVTGIGHEIDTSLADLAADHRALTPTAAAQWVTPDQNEVRARLDVLTRQMEERTRRLLQVSRQNLLYLVGSSPLSNVQGYLETRRAPLNVQIQKLNGAFAAILSSAQSRLEKASAFLPVEMENLLRTKKNRLSSTTSALYFAAPVHRITLMQNEIGQNVQKMENAMDWHYERSRSALDKLDALLQALSVERTLERGFSIVRQNGHVLSSADSLKAGDSLDIRFARGSAVSVVQSVSPDLKTEGEAPDTDQ